MLQYPIRRCGELFLSKKVCLKFAQNFNNLLGKNDGIPDPAFEVTSRPFMKNLLNKIDDVFLPLQLSLQNKLFHFL